MILAVLLVILLYWAVGLSLLQLSGVSKFLNIYERIGSSYVVGIGFVALVFFLFSWSGIVWDRTTALLPFIALIVIAYGIAHKKTWSFPRVILPTGLVSRALIVLLVAVCSFVVFEAQLRPVFAWDVWTSWYMGGKAFFIDRGIAPDFYQYVNYDYPPLQPIFVAYTFILLGQWEDRVTLLIFSAFYIFLLVAFYGFLRRYMSVAAALLFTFLLASTQNLVRHAGRFEAGHADLTLACFLFVSTVLLFAYIRSQSFRVLVMLQCMLGAGALVKNDGVPFLIIVNTALLGYFFLKKQYGRIPYLIIGVSMVLLWQVFKVQYKVPESYLEKGALELGRVPSVLIGTLKEFLLIQRWHFVWIAAGLSLLFFRKNNTQSVLLGLWLLQLLSYLIIYLITPLDPVMQLKNSLDRLLIHILPITVAFIAVTICNIGTFKVLLKNYD